MRIPLIEAGFDNLALLHFALQLLACLLSGVFEYVKISEYYVHHYEPRRVTSRP